MTIQEAVKFVRDHAASILRDGSNDIIGLAVGSKDDGPVRFAKDFAVTAFVEKKRTVAGLAKSRLQDFETVFAASAQREAEKATDINVVEVGSPFTLQSGFTPGLSVPAAHRGAHGGPPATVDTQKPFHALRIGIGVTNPAVNHPPQPYPGGHSVGTVGFYLRDAERRHYLASNNHVLAGGSGRPPSALCSIGDPVCMPGTLDFTAADLATYATLAQLRGSPLCRAQLSGWVPLAFANTMSTPHNRVDLAIAELTGVVDEDEMHRLAFGGSIRSVVQPYLDSEGNVVDVAKVPSAVYKLGRTTGYTEGEVTSFGFSQMIGYPGGKAMFVDQLVITPTKDNSGPFSQPGDSGSAILTNRHELAALLFAGNAAKTIATPIQFVLSDLASMIPSPAVIMAP